MEWKYYKVHTLIKLSGCCLFTMALAHLSFWVFAKDYYHQPSLSNLSVTNVHIQCICIHKKKIKTGCCHHHTSGHKKKGNLVNQSIHQRVISMGINRIETLIYVYRINKVKTINKLLIMILIEKSSGQKKNVENFSFLPYKTS